MTVFVICSQRDPSSARWTLEGVTPNERDAEIAYSAVAKHSVASLSSVEIDDVDDYYWPTVNACGFDENATIPEPPDTVMMRSDT